MVRGINKRIIEINDTQNPYFERAVLYLKDNQADSSKKHWKHRPRVFGEFTDIKTCIPAFGSDYPSVVSWETSASAAAGCALTLWFLW